MAKSPFASRGKCSISATDFLLRLFLILFILSGLSVINVRDDLYCEATDLKVSIVDQIHCDLWDVEEDRCKCYPVVKHPPFGNEQVPFLFVSTSYEKASQVLPELCTIAEKNDLVLFDAETGKTFLRDRLDDRGNPVDGALIQMKPRSKELKGAILDSVKPLWHIRRLDCCASETSKECSFSVTICKDPEVIFGQQTARFYRCLHDNLNKEESLICNSGFYTVQGPLYQINFVLEGYKKHANQMGSGECGMEIIRRMSVETAYRWMQSCTTEEIDEIFDCLNSLPMKQEYPNPADRLAASVNILQQAKKQLKKYTKNHSCF